jgi:glyoxylase-like metal-dependent hydrolase (beta-lactamase superfamily II)
MTATSRRDSWFVTKKISERTFLISEPPHVNSYLICGDSRAVLFDTGMGIANIATTVSATTQLDVLVVNSHYHFDHSGGNALFSEIAIHELGAEPLSVGVPAEWLSMYTEFTHDMLDKFKIYKELDDRYFHLLTEDLFPRPLPADFEPGSWKIPPTVPTRLLVEGDVIDLGGRVLTVAHTPGHTPDGICLYDERSGELFVGDTLTTGPHYAHMPDSDLEAFANSTRRLDKEYRQKVTAIYPAHILRYGVDGSFMTSVADGFEAVLSGEVVPRDGSDIFGDKVSEYWFDNFSIVLPKTEKL